jgi:hypothetical protein
VNEFVNGINEHKTMPVHTFRGTWSVPYDPLFTTGTVNLKAADDHSDVTVDSSQVSAAARYKNQADKNIDYTLLIQRSTGRFTERYTSEGEQTPFLEQQGRCVVPPPQR